MKKEYADRFKFSLFAPGLLFLISFASVSGNFEWKRIYWLAEMPVFIFVLALSVFGALLFANSRAVKVHLTVTDCLVILYFLYLFTRVILAYYPNQPSDRIWIVIASFIFYIVLRARRPGTINGSCGNITLGIVYLASFHALTGIFQRVALLPGYDNSQKVAGLFSNPALLGCFLAIGACLCLGILLKTQSRSRKFINLFLLLLILAGLFLSGSRTAWIAALVPCGLIVMWHNLKGRQKTIKASVPGMLVAILITALIAGTYLYNMNTGSINGRMLIWKIGWNMFKDHPVFGMGYGSFYSEYGNYQAAYFLSETRPEQEVLTASMNYFSFSEPLTLFVEEGIIGALLFVLAGYYVHFVLRGKDEKNSRIVMPGLSIMAVLLIFGLFSYPFQELFFNLLFILSLSFIADLDLTNRPVLIPRLNRYLRPLSIMLLLVPGAFAFMKIQALNNWKSAKEKILFSEGDALNSYNRAYRQLSNNGAFLFNYGSELADLGQHEQALVILNQAAKYGNSVELHLQLGKLYQSLGQLKQAERSLLVASAMNPKLFLPLAKLMLFYKETRQFSRCREIAGKIVRKPVKIPSETIDNIKKLAESNLNNHEPENNYSISNSTPVDVL